MNKALQYVVWGLMFAAMSFGFWDVYLAPKNVLVEVLVLDSSSEIPLSHVTVNAFQEDSWDAEPTASEETDSSGLVYFALEAGPMTTFTVKTRDSVELCVDGRPVGFIPDYVDAIGFIFYVDRCVVVQNDIAGTFQE